MDRYELNTRIDQIKRAMEKKDFATAATTADLVDWSKVKNNSLLMIVADAYEAAKEYGKAKEILLIAYKRTPMGRQLAYRLALISVKMKDFDDADAFYGDFKQIAPYDTAAFILEYRIAKARGESPEKLISILEAYKQVDVDEKWTYCLARLYDEIGNKERCVELCDEIILWFNEGEYVTKAMKLKQKHTPLSKGQEERLFAQETKTFGPVSEQTAAAANAGDGVLRGKEAPADDALQGNEATADDALRGNEASADDALRGKTAPADDEQPAERYPDIEVKQFAGNGSDTIDIQQTIAESMKEIMNDDEAAPAEESGTDNLQNTSSVLNPIFKMEGDGQISLDMIKEPEKPEKQITGQLDIEAVLKDLEARGILNKRTVSGTVDAMDKAAEVVEKAKIETEEYRNIRKTSSLLETIEKIRESEAAEEAVLSGEDPVKETVIEDIIPDVEPEIEDVIDTDMVAEAVAEAKEEDEASYRNRTYDDMEGFVFIDTRDLSEIIAEVNEQEAAAKKDEEKEAEPEQEAAEEAAAEPEEEAEAEIAEEAAAEPAEEPGSAEAADDEEEPDWESWAERVDAKDVTPLSEAELSDEELPTEDPVADDLGFEGIFDSPADGEILLEPLENEAEAAKPEAGEPGETEAAKPEDEEPGETEAADPKQAEPARETMVFHIDGLEPSDGQESETETKEESEEKSGSETGAAEQEPENEAGQPEEKSGDKAESKAESKAENESENGPENESENEEDSKSENKSGESSDEKGSVKTGGYVDEQIAAAHEDHEYYHGKHKLNDADAEAIKGFLIITGLEERITRTIESLADPENLDGTSAKNNIIIMGDPQTGKTTLASDLIKLINKKRGRYGRKIAKVKAPALNAKGFSNSFNRILKHDLIIEDASKLSDETIEEILDKVEFYTDDMIIALEDTAANMKEILDDFPEFDDVFNNRLVLKEFNLDEWLSFAEKHARSRGYAIDPIGKLALAQSIDEVYGINQGIEEDDVKDIVNAAIKNREKKVGGRIARAFRRRSKDEELTELLERDFLR